MAGDEAMDVFSVWKRHIVSLGSSLGTPKDLSVAFERRGARPHYVRHEGEFHWLDKPGVGMPALPQVVLNHHQNNPRTCFYDVFAEVDRAWASVDNTLYIWRIGDKEPTPVMYSHEAQYITCVGLAPVKKGIFMVSVKYLLVVCTNVEVTLVGVCFSNGRPDGQLQLTPLAGYSVPCSTVPMAAACTTASGHIFLGATDGNVYQVQYGKRQACRLACVSRSFLSMLGAGVLPGYLAKRIWAAVPIRLLAVDNDRHFLYTLAENHLIRAFHLGPDGDTAPQEFAAVANVHEASASVPNAASVMTRDRGGAAPAVAHLAVIPPHASRTLHVVAVLSDGCRVYFEAQPSRRALRARAVMPNDGLAGTAAGLRGGGNVRAVRAALYSSNTLLVVERGTLDGNLSELIATLPNPYRAPPQDGGVIDAQRGRAMEVVAPGAELLPGDVRALRELPAPSPLTPLLRRGLADEATLQLLTPAPQFVAMSNVGIVTFTRRRPLDVLKSLLINFNEETVVNYFHGVGPSEASCMCFAIATAAAAPALAPLATSATLPISATQAQSDRALSCLSDPKYIGTAMWPSDPGMPDYGFRGRGEAGQYGSVLSVSEPEWSHMHAGLVLFVYRLLHKVWDLPLLRVVGSGGSGKGGRAVAAAVGGLTAVELALPAETLAALQGAAAALGGVVVRVLELLQGRGVGERKMWSPMEDVGGLNKRSRRQSAALLELERVAAIGKFAHACAEALLLCRKLVQYNVGRHLQKGRADLCATCDKFRLSLLLSSDGVRMATGVLMDLLKRHTPSGRLPVSLSDDLLHGCPMFFPYHQQQYLTAFQQLEGVNKPGISAAQKEELAAEFMGKMTPGLAEAVVLRDIIPLLLPLGKYGAIVQLSIAKADGQDSSGRHLEPSVEGANAASGRAAHFLPLAEAATTLAGSQEALSRLLRAVLAAHDPVLSHLLFRALIADGAGSALISCIPDSSALKLHLAALGAPRPYVLTQQQIQAAQQAALDGDQLKHLALLAELFVINRDHVAAAEVMTAIGVAAVLPSTPEAARPDRVMALQQALVHAGNSGDTALERRTESEWRQARIQAEVLSQAHRRLRKARASGDTGDADRVQLSITKLQLESLSMNALFNDFALPMNIWSCGLLIMRESNSFDDGNVRQLWDLLCKDEIEAVYQAGGSTADALRALCSQIIDLAGALGATPWLHLRVIALRLLQVVAGHWVARDAPPDGPAAAAKCLCDALPDQHRALLPALVDIVRQRSPLESATAQQSLVRNEAAWETVLQTCQLYFRAAVARSQGLGGAEGDGASHELEALLDAVRTFAVEAAKHAHLAATQRRFDDTAHELQRLLSQRRRAGHLLRR